MPYNHTQLELRLNSCNQKLEDLFAEKPTQLDTIESDIKAVQSYYHLSYTKANTAQAVEKIAASYESFVEQLIQVKNGKLQPETASEQMKSAIASRKMKTVFHNLAKAAELIFWAATTCTMYAAFISMALPLIMVQPLVGVAVGITVIGALLKSAFNALSCFKEFKSFSRHSVEYTREANLVAFFRPEPLLESAKIQESLEISSCSLQSC